MAIKIIIEESILLLSYDVDKSTYTYRRTAVPTYVPFFGI